MKRLAIITTHPIQYNAPFFKMLAQRQRIAIKVFYTWSQANENIYDPGFGVHRKWDIPLLDGYEFEFVHNVAKHPGSHHFRGINNPGLIKTVEQWRPDAILIFGWAFRSHLACMRYFKGKIPVLFRGDSTLLNEKNGLRKILRRTFLRWVYSHVDTGLFVGKNNRDYFSVHGLKDNQLVAAPHAVDNRRFGDTPGEDVTALRRSLGFGPDDFVVLFAGKLEAVKNPLFMVELAEAVPDPAIKFLIVGNGLLEQTLKAHCKKDERITFLDFQNQSRMPLIYQSANVFILPSLSETWGLAANEAMACGLPVMLSDRVGGAADLVQGNGLVFGLQEITKVKNYLINLKTDSAAYLRTKEASHQTVQKFSFERIARAVEEVMETIK